MKVLDILVVSALSFLQCGIPGFDPWVGKMPWRREWLPTPVFLPGEFHGQRTLAHSPWGRKEPDRTVQLTLSLPCRLPLHHLSDVSVHGTHISFPEIPQQSMQTRRLETTEMHYLTVFKLWSLKSKCWLPLKALRKDPSLPLIASGSSWCSLACSNITNLCLDCHTAVFPVCPCAFVFTWSYSIHAAITKFHKLGDTKKTGIHFTQFWKLEV